MKLVLILLLSSLPHFAFGGDFIPEASGVCRIGPHLLIAGDEEPQSLWMAADAGKTEMIKVNGGTWDDMEGLANVDQDHFFAVTSHSRTKKGKRKPEREQLMLMAIKGKKISVEKSWSLRELIIPLLEKSFGNDLDMKTVEGATPNEGGFNIEGLAYREGRLYLGLRSPVTNSGKALIVVIKNGKELIQGASPALDKILAIDLGGKGIRSLDSNKKGLLILAGSRNDTAETFGLSQLLLGAGSLEDFYLNGFDDLLRPEGLVAEENGDVTFVQDFEQPQGQEIIVRLTP